MQIRICLYFLFQIAGLTSISQNVFEKVYFTNPTEYFTGVTIQNQQIITTISQDNCGPCSGFEGIWRLDRAGDTISTVYHTHGTSDEQINNLIKSGSSQFLYTESYTLGSNYQFTLYCSDTNGILWQKDFYSNNSDLIPLRIFNEGNKIYTFYDDKLNGGCFVTILDVQGNNDTTITIGSPPVYFAIKDVALLSGIFYVLGTGSSYTFICSIDLTGAIHSTHFFNIDSRNIAKGALNTLYVSELMLDSVGDAQIKLNKLDTAGNILFSTLLTHSGSHFPIRSILLQNADLLILGMYTDGVLTKTILLKCDSNGTKLWEKEFCPINYYSSYFSEMIESPDSIILLAGQVQVQQGVFHPYLVACDQNGLTLSENILFPSPPFDLQILSEKEYAIKGVGPFLVKLFNLKGQLVSFIHTLSNFNLSDFTYGIYICEITDLNKNILVKRINIY